MDKILLDYLPVLSTLFLTACYTPQVLMTYRTKDVKSISLMFWVLLNIALTCLLINAAVVFIKFGTYGYLVAEIINEGFALVMLIMVIKYKRRDKANESLFSPSNKYQG